MSTASFPKDVGKNRAGVRVTRSFGLNEKSSMHVTDFCSHKLRRVARSTTAAETLAASEGYDRAYYCWAISRWMGKGLHCGQLLVVDNSSLFTDMSSTRSPKEKRLKVDLALLWEAFEQGNLGGII
jgi:hypothetical protein